MNASQTPLADALQAFCHSMPLRVRAIDHAVAEYRKLELENQSLKQQLEAANFRPESPRIGVETPKPPAGMPSINFLPVTKTT
jgi:hypothetical protein